MHRAQIFQEFRIVLRRYPDYLTFPSPIVFSSLQFIHPFLSSPFFPLSPPPLLSCSNFGHASCAFPISRKDVKRVDCWNLPRTSRVSRRYFERNMHWREREREPLVRENATSSTCRRPSLSPFHLAKLLNLSVHRSELSTPNSTPFASFPSNNAAPSCCATISVRLGQTRLIAESRCVSLNARSTRDNGASPLREMKIFFEFISSGTRRSMEPRKVAMKGRWEHKSLLRIFERGGETTNWFTIVLSILAIVSRCDQRRGAVMERAYITHPNGNSYRERSTRLTLEMNFRIKTHRFPRLLLYTREEEFTT